MGRGLASDVERLEFPTPSAFTTLANLASLIRDQVRLGRRHIVLAESFDDVPGYL